MDFSRLCACINSQTLNFALIDFLNIGELEMKFIDPQNLELPRVYFTEFDRVTYSQVEWNNQEINDIKLNLERKVKLLALIKGFVVIATSHLFESELAQEFIKENPIVLEKGILVPALISKYKSFTDFYHYKKNESKEKELYSQKEDINCLLMNSVDSVISWDVNLTSQWFKERLIKDLNEEKSVLRHNLSDIKNTVICDLSDKISEIISPSRGDIYKLGKNTGNKLLWEILCNYTDFVYYLSGAHAVNSEGVLPQENLIDFSITDLEKGKTKLSEYEIFYKIFVNIIHDKTQKYFPVEILDLLTFKEIIELRESLFHSKFIEKYNLLMEKTKNKVDLFDTDKIILSLSELCEFEDELQKIFTEAVVNEIKIMKKIEKVKKGGKLLTNIGSSFTFYGTIESVYQIIISLLSFSGFDKQINNIEKRVSNNLIKLKEIVERNDFDNKPILMKFLEEIRKKYVTKIV
ncbi:MAG: hypothetical protein HW421_3111 [Ignavibacteria bacterium]|nr:hypothetical protein [Ignavibacteria bacterium]